MSKARHVRIQGYIADKLLSFYRNNPFAPSLTQLVNRELASAMVAIDEQMECVERRDSAEGMLKKLKFQREENGIWTNSEL
jgi:hypothetical protein